MNLQEGCVEAIRRVFKACYEIDMVVFFCSQPNCLFSSHGTKLIMPRSTTFKTKEVVPVQPDFVLKVQLCNLLPSIINSVPCDRIVQTAYYANAVQDSIISRCSGKEPDFLSCIQWGRKVDWNLKNGENRTYTVLYFIYSVK